MAGSPRVGKAILELPMERGLVARNAKANMRWRNRMPPTRYGRLVYSSACALWTRLEDLMLNLAGSPSAPFAAGASAPSRERKEGKANT